MAKISGSVQRTTQSKRIQIMNRKWKRSKAMIAQSRHGVVLARSIHGTTKSDGRTRPGSVGKVIQVTSIGHQQRRIVFGRLVAD